MKKLLSIISISMIVLLLLTSSIFASTAKTQNAVIRTSNVTVKKGERFTPFTGVKAFDDGGRGKDITNKVFVEGSINTARVGQYKLTYSVTGQNGVKVSKVRTITVRDTNSSTNRPSVQSQDQNNYNGHSYKLFDIDMTWKDAKAYCEGLGGHLAIINSSGKQKFVESLIKNSNRQIFWLGATDEATEGIWKWIDGSNIVYSNWSPGEPNNSGSEDYLVIYNSNAGRGSFGQWNDVSNSGSIWSSSGKKGFICEWDY